MESRIEPVYRFGPAVVDVPRRALSVDGSAQHLEPQAFDLLVYLISQRDRVVSKEELLDEVWGDQFVSESALTTRVKEIRRVLGDDGTRQAMIKNYRGRGYRFVATIEGGLVHQRPADRLVGRDRDFVEVQRLLGEAAVVTLVGPGGVGKTTLARAVAHRWGADTGGTVVFVDLASVDKPGDVIHVLRREAGLADAGAADEDVIAAISDLNAVIVIDNCEHVIAEAARLIGDITGRRGEARIIATSRQRLGADREQVWPVTPLDFDASRRLLEERARAVDPSYSLRAEDEDSLDRLLTMLDRLPLAIEMAAARLPTMRVSDLVEHLSHRIDLIEAPTRGVDDRQRTLPALVAWSENLLEPEAKELLSELSVFAGSVAAADVAAVVGGDATELAMGPLAELVSCSLAVTEISAPATRYRLLETVRSIVSARRDPVVDESHARYYARVVEEADRRLRTPDEPAAARRIDEVLAEVRAAHTWARGHDLVLASAISTSLLHYGQERQWSEPAAWVARLAEIDQPGVEPFAAAVAAEASNHGDYSRAKALAERALPAGDARVRASAHDTLANIGVYTGDLDLARLHGDALFELGRDTGDDTTWALGLLGVVLARLYGGDTAGAREAMAAWDRPRGLSPTACAWLEYSEGELLAADGREREAIGRFDRAIELGESVGAGFVASVARVSALAARSRAGDIDEALAAFAAVLGGYRRTHRLTHAITALRNLIWLMVRAECDEPAMVLLGALDGPGVKSTYGVESELMAEARGDVEKRHGVGPVTEWLARGSTHDASWALDHAIGVLEAR